MSIFQWMAVFCAALIVTASAKAQQSTRPHPQTHLYRVDLRQEVAVDATESMATARELAQDYAAVLLSSPEGGSFTMRLTESRAQVMASDPRVRSIRKQEPMARPPVRIAPDSMDWTAGLSYQYDGSGNIESIGTDTFGYDTVGRLVQAETNGVRRNYEYDAFGNRTRCREEEGTPNEGECQNGWTISSSTNRVNQASYDDAGNVTVQGNHHYTYDALNMQTRDEGTLSGMVTREYLYNASDERIATYTVGQGLWQWTLRDPEGHVIREMTSRDGPNGPGTASWEWTKDYIWRDNLLLATRQKEGSITTTYHYHLDHLGSPRRITDDNDVIVGSHDYIPFGPEASGSQSEPSLTRMKYTGHERDLVGAEAPDTLDYMHARYYSPMMGRFLSVDPVLATDVALKNPQGWNRYAYVRNNPMNATDPTGKLDLLNALRHALDQFKPEAEQIRLAGEAVKQIPVLKPGGRFGFPSVELKAGRFKAGWTEEVAVKGSVTEGKVTAQGKVQAVIGFEGTPVDIRGGRQAQMVVFEGGKFFPNGLQLDTQNVGQAGTMRVNETQATFRIGAGAFGVEVGIDYGKAGEAAGRTFLAVEGIVNKIVNPLDLPNQ